MKTWEELWKFTDSIPGSFTKLSGEKLLKYAMDVPPFGCIVEVGVDQGRSASLLMEAIWHTSTELWLIDKWESILADNALKVHKLRSKFPPSINCYILRESSVNAAADLTLSIDLIHIDAHHHDDIPDGGPELDCAGWLPKVKSGGVACFHDYDSTFHDVKKAVDKHTAGWEDLGVWDSLAIRRKP